MKPETTRLSPRDGFTVSFALSLVTGLFCHHRQQNDFRQLDASVGASGPHDFAVRINIARPAISPASTASRPNVRDDREAPLLSGRDGVSDNFDLPDGTSEIFFG